MTVQKTYKILVSNTRKFFKLAKIKNAVIGVSGGVDSALAAAIVADAVGAKNLTALILPYEGITPKSSTLGAKNFCKSKKIHFEIIEISRLVAVLEALLPWAQTQAAKANTIARARMLLLYNYANSKKAMVVGTGNLSELSVGYFTKYGDGASDLLPLADLTKTKVYALAKYKHLPNAIIRKAPSAELRKGQADEAELNITYKELDKLIECVSQNNSFEIRLLNNKISKNKLRWFKRRFASTMHKRATPAIISSRELM